jgi:hypothetical protein
MSVTRDKIGLERALALALKSLIDGVVSALEAEPLPNALPSPEVAKVKNPF